jgi:hypothetical protein
VKKISCAVACTTLLFAGTACAADNYPEDLEDVAAAQMTDSDGTAGSKPFRLSARTDWLGQAKLQKHRYRHQHVDFHISDVKGDAVLYFNPEYSEGFGVALDYDNMYFKWNRNKYFKRTNFNEVSLTAFAFTNRAARWSWQFHATMNWDTKYNNFSNYTNYDLLLWGRYEQTCSLGLHGGVLALTGMKIDRIFPIIGFDWKYNENWKINAIFPLNLSIVYTINDHWNCAVAGRFFEVRRRLSKHDNLSQGLFQYRNKGIELALNYEGESFTANIHGGITAGGEFILSNNHNKHKRHYDLGTAGYVGGELAYKF